MLCEMVTLDLQAYSCVFVCVCVCVCAYLVRRKSCRLI